MVKSQRKSASTRDKRRESPPFVFFVRRKIAVLFLVLEGACAAGALPLLGIESLMELDGGVGLRLSLRYGDLGAVLLCHDGPATPPLGFGFASPWLRIGRLVLRGLPRLTENPFGFGAGSGAFREKSDFLVDAALTANPGIDVVLAPVPGSFNLFSRSLTGGGTAVGSCVSFPLDPAVSLDGLVELSRPPADLSDEWILSAPPFPGGDILHISGRLLFDEPGVSLSLSGTASACELGPPGGLFQSWLSLGKDALGADFFLGAVAGDYVTMDGRESPDSLELSARIRASSPLGSMVLCYSRTLGRSDWIPHPYIPSRDRIDFALEKVFVSGRAALLSARVAGRNDVEFDGEGRRSGGGECSAALICAVAREESSLSAALSRTGARLSLGVKYPVGTILLGFEGNLSAKDRRRAATALLAARIGVKDATMSFRAGVEDMPLDGPCADARSILRVSVGWEARAGRARTGPRSP